MMMLMMWSGASCGVSRVSDSESDPLQVHPTLLRPPRISQECEAGVRVGWHAAKRQGLEWGGVLWEGALSLEMETWEKGR